MITGIKNLLTSLWVKSHGFFGFKKFISLLSLGFVTLVLVLSFLASSLSPIRDLKTQKAEAATSSTLNFQARLLNSSGNLVADGYYNIRFKLYDGGTQGGGAGKGQTLAGTQLWTESYYDSNGVTAGNDNRVRVANGYFSVNLGSQTAFPSINWDEELWLTMDIGGTTQTATPTYDGEMLSTIPAANSRLKLTAVPYAFKAGQLAKTTGSFNSTLDFATQTASRSILLPDADGTVCLQNATACGFATATGAAGYIQNSTSLQTTANFNIQSAAAGSVGGIIRGASSQTADLFQLQDSAGGTLAAFNSSGILVGPAVRASGTSANSFQLQTNNGTSLFDINSFYGTLGFGAGGNIATSGASGGFVNITSNTGAGRKTLVLNQVNGADSILEANNNGTLVFSIGQTGAVLSRNSTNSSTAFQVQNSSSQNLFAIDTSSNILTLGNTSAALSQTINIGNNSTASSTSNVNIGSSIAGTTAITGPTTITNRTSGSASTLIVSNSTSTGNIFEARDNSTAVMTIADGGATTFRNATDSDSAYLFQNSLGERVLTVATTAYSSANTNLILNPSFEMGHTGWNGKNGAGNTSGSSSAAATAYMGTAHGTINATAVGHGKSYAVTLSPSTQYAFSAYVRVGSGTMSTLVLGRQDQSGTDIDCAASPTIGTSWTRVSCIFTTGGTISSSNVYIKQSDGTTRTVYLDAVQLVAGSSVTSFNNGELALNTPITRRLVVAGYTAGTGQLFEVQDQSGNQVFGVDTDSNTVIIAGTAAINGGNITTDDTTFNLLNSTATTINFGGGATTALNIGPTGATGTSINLAGGSGATGCTVDGATGNLTCSGAISTTATTGTQGWWSRSGTTLQPATAGDHITTSGNISTSSTGTMTSAGLLTANGGLTVEAGDTFTMNGDAFTDLTGNGLTVSGNALTVDATSATGFFRNGGNSFAGAATIGTNDGNVLNVETNNSTRFQVSASASTLTGQGTTILTSTGSLDLSSAAASNLTITTGTTGTLALDTGTTGGITIGNNGNAKTITIGNSTGATAVNLQAGTNGVSIAANGIANTVQIGNTSGAVTQSINIGTNSTASSTNNVNIGSSVAGTTAITGATTITNRTSGSTDTLIVSNSTSTGNIFVARDNATAVMTIADGGATTFSNTNTSAFVIQNASSQSLLVANTSTQRLAVGPAAAAANGVLTVGTNTAIASGGVYFGTDTNLYRYGAGQLASDGSIISTTGNFYTTGAGTGLLFGNTNTSGIINALANGAGDMYFYNGSASPVLTLTQTGTALFRNSTNSTVAFQIQSASGSDTMFIADTTTTNKIKIGNSTGTGTATTIFQLDGAASAPFGTGQTAYLGSMYYDTTQGKLQCYEDRNGTAAWGACGSAPNNIITLTPEYTGAVLNGTGVGTMTSDFCSNEAGVLVVGTLCANHETRNFYKWTSPQGTNQTYSIYVNYKLPTTFNSFEDANTIKLTALSDNLSNASATLQVLRKNVAGNTISSCGTATTINSSVSTWQQTSFGGNETSCGFVGGDYVIFKIDVTARSGANIYVENLDFTYRNT